MKLLLHTCCAPCTIIPYRDLSADHAVTLYWYNPNIQPATEYMLRRDGMDLFCEKTGAELVDERVYDTEEFIQRVVNTDRKRCNVCYAMRLGRAAKQARELGCDAFTTTIFYSPYQDHELTAAAGKAAGEEHGVEFLVRDWSGQYREGAEESRRMGLYRQKYCGCLWSEKERYEKKLKKYTDKATEPQSHRDH